MKKYILVCCMILATCYKTEAQIYIITADHLFYIEHNEENEIELDLYFQQYKNEKTIPPANLFTLDYDNLVVKTEMNNVVKAYPISQITKQDDLIDCVYIDTVKNINYHLKYYYKHPTLTTSFLFISWKNNNEDPSVSESVYVGPQSNIF
jgi:hypothetical protein